MSSRSRDAIRATWTGAATSSRFTGRTARRRTWSGGRTGTRASSSRRPTRSSNTILRAGPSAKSRARLPPAAPRSELVADIAEQPVAGGRVRAGLDAQRRGAVDHPDDAAAVLGHGHQDL